MKMYRVFGVGQLVENLKALDFVSKMAPVKVEDIGKFSLRMVDALPAQLL